MSEAEGDEMNFSGLTDPDDAPQDFKVSVGGNEFIIQGIMAEDEPRSSDLNVSTFPRVGLVVLLKLFTNHS